MASNRFYVGRYPYKRKKMPPTFEKVIATNALTLGDIAVNKVKAFSQEVRMTNIRNCTNAPAFDT